MNNVTDLTIQHNSVVSLHVQLHNQLRQVILSGRWPFGSRIPSELQLAEHLKLSRGTVRLALQLAEVEGLIERTAGRGSFVAYAPSKEQKNRLIAFLTCDFDAESHLLILTGAESVVKARGYQLVFSKAKNQQEEADILLTCQESDTAGVLLWTNSVHSYEQNAATFQRLRLPIVLVDRKIHGFDCDFVTSDNYGGAQAAMRHLIELGHREIVFLSHHELDISTVTERYRAYCDVMQESGVAPRKPWLIGEPGKEPGVRNVLQLAANKRGPEIQTIKDHMANQLPRPTAIFAVNDYLAIFALRALKTMNLQIPDDISLVGFDGTDLAAQLEVPLTTVAQDPFAIGQRAAQILIDRIEGYSGSFNYEVIPTQLRVRSSTSIPVRA